MLGRDRGRYLCSRRRGNHPKIFKMQVMLSSPEILPVPSPVPARPAPPSHRFLAASLRIALLGLVVATAPGCALLNQFLGQGGGAQGVANLLNPRVSATPLRLSRSPSMQALGAYFCPQVINDPIARMGCSVALGSPPPREQMVFEFATTVTIQNPNNVPIPALDLLLAMKMFQGQGAESLGAICVSMCGANDRGCNGQPKPGACTSNQPTIRTMRDFVSAVPGLIAGLVGAALSGELQKSTIAAGGNVVLNLNFGLGIDQALRVIQRVIPQLVESQLQRGRPSLVIPVSGEGTVFVNMPGSGRIGVGFGPLSTNWQVL